MTTIAVNVLNPSEQVFLQGERFASKAGLVNRIKLMHTDQDVNVSELVQAMFAAAFLYCEKLGAIRLEVRQKKLLFGLANKTTLYAEPVRPVDLPAPSLEGQIYEMAANFKKDKEKNEVSTLVFAWLREDTNLPWQHAVKLVQECMAARRLLSVVQEKKLKIFTVNNYALPEETRRLAAELAAEPVQQLLLDCQKNRPEVWKLLVKHIKSGIDNRHESDHDMD
ncbi:MAG TPA: hypothetical protein VFF68_04115 [Anaerolineaceae bacterium]|nr:hypothetical protein [Anaerolineaceae bacterium]